MFISVKKLDPLMVKKFGQKNNLESFNFKVPISKSQMAIPSQPILKNLLFLPRTLQNLNPISEQTKGRSQFLKMGFFKVGPKSRWLEIQYCIPLNSLEDEKSFYTK
jgi:hypothetical protein